MRRDVLAKEIDKIIEDLRSSGIVEMMAKAIEEARPGNGKTDGTYVNLSAVTNYLGLIKDYTVEQKYILHVFDIDELTNVDRWQKEVQ